MSAPLIFLRGGCSLRIPAHGGQDFQVNVDIDSSATWTELRCDRGQFPGKPQ
jgi:hypothetical protein